MLYAAIFQINVSPEVFGSHRGVVSLAVFWVMMVCGLVGGYQLPVFMDNILPTSSGLK
jgi:hypothetical protein